MSKHKSSRKEKKKGSQLVIRVDRAERDAFVALCDQLDTSAAREIRRFMRERVADHAGAGQLPVEAAKSAEVPAPPGDEPATDGPVAGETGSDADASPLGAQKLKKKSKRGGE